MIQIPKNVMQIGEINPHTKIYMEDYVHTFLERRKTAEVYLAFGKKEEQNGILYYMIYGVEKKTDWERGSLPYFKKYDRLGTIEGPADARVLKPVRGSGILLDGYFVFYEQNEDMQTYMIAVRETEELKGNEETEAVMEAVRTRREMHRQRQQEQTEREQEEGKSAAHDPKERNIPLSEKIRIGKQKALQKMTWRDRDPAERKRERIQGRSQERNRRQILRERESRKRKARWTIPDLCRVGSLFLLLILVLLGLTSLNRYPDMRAITGLFADAAKSLWGEEGERAVSAEVEQNPLIVEETAAQEEGALVEEAVPDEEADEAENFLVARDGQVEWRIGDEEQQSFPTESATVAETISDGEMPEKLWDGETNPEETEPSSGEEETSSREDDGDQNETDQNETARQAIARPVTYVVKKGDSLAQIARKFYGNTSKIQEICALNGIEDPDQIRPGQNILLP